MAAQRRGASKTHKKTTVDEFEKTQARAQHRAPKKRRRRQNESASINYALDWRRCAAIIGAARAHAGGACAFSSRANDRTSARASTDSTRRRSAPPPATRAQRAKHARDSSRAYMHSAAAKAHRPSCPQTVSVEREEEQRTTKASATTRTRIACLRNARDH